MNNKGSVVIYTMMIGILIIILALALAPAVQETISNGMNASSENSIGLDCNNESISNFNKAACVGSDLTLFYFIGTLIFIGGLIITAKVTFG
jgi:hypothetical protein